MRIEDVAKLLPDLLQGRVGFAFVGEFSQAVTHNPAHQSGGMCEQFSEMLSILGRWRVGSGEAGEKSQCDRWIVSLD